MKKVLKVLKNRSSWVWALLLSCALSFAGGYYYRTPKEIVKVEEKIVEKEVDTDKSTRQNKTVKTVTEYPDGKKETKVVETEKEETESKDTSHREIDSERSSEEDKTAASDVWRPDYSLGVSAEMSPALPQPTYNVHAGYRLMGNMWATSSYNFPKNEVTIGIRIDF